jgi:hypothetical protein
VSYKVSDIGTVKLSKEPQTYQPFSSSATYPFKVQEIKKYVTSAIKAMLIFNRLWIILAIITISF